MSSYVKMLNPMHIRKRRLLEALSQPEIAPDDSIELFPTVFCDEVISVSSTESIQPAKKRKNDLEILDENVEMKFRVLEGWEQNKRKAIAHMAAELEMLASMESEISQIEEELENKGIQVTESMFKEYFQRKISATPKSVNNGNQPSACSTPVTSKPSSFHAVKSVFYANDNVVVIGPNGTTVPRSVVNSIHWAQSPMAITRKMLMAAFGKDTLATHTLSGKPSPAFLDVRKPTKQRLDPLKVADVMHFMTANTNMTPQAVRTVITVKCADEAKVRRQREQRQAQLENDLFKFGDSTLF